MNENFLESGCSRASDLIGFLYGEISQTEAIEFQHHLKDCLFCQTDLVAFGGIRQSVADWRLEALGSDISTRVKTQTYNSAKPSALAAIREFFNLSPLWMKGAVAFASLLFCLFAVLAFERLTEHTSSTPLKAMNAEPVVEDVTPAQPKAVEDNKLTSGENKQLSVDSKPNRETTTAGVRRRVTRRGSVGSRTESTAQRRLTQAEREQLAADLRLVSEMEDPDLDLIADRLNRD